MLPLPQPQQHVSPFPALYNPHISLTSSQAFPGHWGILSPQYIVRKQLPKPCVGRKLATSLYPFRDGFR